jgi:hypothetical protein
VSRGINCNRISIKLMYLNESKTTGNVVIESRNEHVWGSGGIALPFLTSTVDGGEWLASRSFRFTPQKRASGLHYVGSWVGSHIQSRQCTVKKKKFCHRRESNSGCYAIRYLKIHLLPPQKQCFSNKKTNRFILFKGKISIYC